jgi:hypothetical protein
MRLRTGTAVVVLAASAGLSLVAPSVARADSGTTVYADKTASTCSDSSPLSGSSAAPFCSIGAAAAIAQPGQTVQVGPGDYEEDVTVTRSGSPGAPITFVGAPAHGGYSGTFLEGATHAFDLAGVHDVVVRNMQLRAGQEAVLVDNSSDVVIDSVYSNSSGWESTTSAPVVLYGAIRITGQSDAVTVSRDQVFASHGRGIVVDQGASGTVVTGDDVRASNGSAVSVSASPGTAVTGNTLGWGCDRALALSDGSTGSSIENNLVSESDAMPNGAAWGPCPVLNQGDISVSADSTAGTKVDYNLTASGTTQAPYSWAGADYADLAAFQQATGQAAHDLEAIPGISGGGDILPVEGSPLIDSADPDAPGELSTDILGHPRVDDPLVPNSGPGGSFFDRGAYEFQDPISYTSPSLSEPEGPAPVSESVTGKVVSPWSSQVTYTADFGDGAGKQTSTTLPITHVYENTGEYPIAVTATDALGGSVTWTLNAQVNAPGLLIPVLKVKTNVPLTAYPASSSLAVEPDMSASSSPWPITSYVLAYGDGTTGSNVYPNSLGWHVYPHPGTYTAVLTEHDAGGRTATTSQLVTVGSNYFPLTPGRLLDTRTGQGGPLGPLSRGQVVKLKLSGGSVPTVGLTAAVLNVTAVSATTPGFVTAYPDGSPRPNT